MSIRFQLAQGFLPYEPEDRLEIEGLDGVWVIKEIKMSQYIVSKKVEFELLVEHETNENHCWILPSKIKRRIV